MQLITDTDRAVFGFAGQEVRDGLILEDTFTDNQAVTHVEGNIQFLEAFNAFDYEVEKVPMFRESAVDPVDGAFCLVRTDTDDVVHNMVGNGYVPYQNAWMMTRLNEQILTRYPDIKIESAVTTNGGQLAQLNMLLDEHTVPGDIGPTWTKMLWQNAHGGKPYANHLHQVRLICGNGMTIDEMVDGITTRHTKNAASRIENQLWDYPAIMNAIKSRNEWLDSLTGKPVNRKNLKAFLDALIPIPEKEGKAQTIAEGKHETIRTIFSQEDNLRGPIRHTQYALLQAVTDFADHYTRQNGDDMTRRLNGLTGSQNNIKQQAAYLLAA